jgi:hypothetical protein
MYVYVYENMIQILDVGSYIAAIWIFKYHRINNRGSCASVVMSLRSCESRQEPCREKRASFAEGRTSPTLWTSNTSRDSHLTQAA